MPMVLDSKPKCALAKCPAHFSMTPPWGKSEKFVSKAVPLLPAMQGLEVASVPDPPL